MLAFPGYANSEGPGRQGMVRRSTNHSSADVGPRVWGHFGRHQSIEDGWRASSVIRLPFRIGSMEAHMLTNWISPETITALNDGFVVAIMLEARGGEAEALAEILRVMTAPTMAEPGVKLFLPYLSPANKLLFF